MKPSLKQFLTTLIFVLIYGFAYSQTDSTVVKSELRNKIVKETKEGKLDFFTPIKGHEYDGIQVKPGLYDTKLGVALVNWGKQVYAMGVKTLGEAYSIFSEYKGRDINKKEMEYIKIGYNREI